jgi:hypothetical protein
LARLPSVKSEFEPASSNRIALYLTSPLGETFAKPRPQHPEEARRAVSKDAEPSCKPERILPFSRASFETAFFESLLRMLDMGVLRNGEPSGEGVNPHPELRSDLSLRER